jgi:hypothetical protein
VEKKDSGAEEEKEGVEEVGGADGADGGVKKEVVEEEEV